MYANCRDELLEVVTKLVNKKSINEFTVAEVLEAMMNNNTVYSVNTIKTHITSRCCMNAPKNHYSTYDDYERVNKGVYKLKNYK